MLTAPTRGDYNGTMQTTKELLDSNIKELLQDMRDAPSARDKKDLAGAVRELCAAQPFIGEMDSTQQVAIQTALGTIIEEAAAKRAASQQDSASEPDTTNE